MVYVLKVILFLLSVAMGLATRFVYLDYKNGYLDINDKILFWKYPDSIAEEIKGVIYLVTMVDSTFAGGVFKQVLTCVIETLGEFNNERPNEREPSTTAVASSPSGLLTERLTAVSTTAFTPATRAAYPGLPLRQPTQDD